jgi:lipopolysaccharide/colanic/teichoic acid biosynthesis glycosyltransferase
MYARYIKRPLDFFLSLCAIAVLLPLLVVLTLVGAVAMKGNPFFTQLRPGKDERIFKLIKFRTMTCEKGENGNPLPDEVRLTKYGKFLRATSLDELPELFNILKGDMAIIGPRPLSVKYLGFYNDWERHRHDVLPGLTGLAQVKGRNAISWEEKFEWDLEYINHISFINDVKIIFMTVACVLGQDNIGQGEEAPVSLHILRAKEQKTEVLTNDN